MNALSVTPKSIVFLAAYAIVWLVALPSVADVSAPVAIMALAILSAAVCYMLAKERGRNPMVWGIVGAVTGFFELGILAIVAVIAWPRK